MSKELIYRELTEQIIGGCIEVHRYWGPGLYEEIYERSLCAELSHRKIPFESQLHLPLIYKGVTIGDDLKLEVWVDRKVIVEAKSVAELLPVHEAQILTYMRLTKCRVGLLINFNVATLKEGIKRFVL